MENQCLWIALGHLVSLWREDKSNTYFGGLTYEFWIEYGFYKGNTKFTKLNSFLCVQRLN